MWRCPKCFSEYFVPSVCNCGYDGRSEPNVTTRNAFDISLTVLGVAIVVTVLCLLWDEIISTLLRNPRTWSAIFILAAAGASWVYQKFKRKR